MPQFGRIETLPGYTELYFRGFQRKKCFTCKGKKMLNLLQSLMYRWRTRRRRDPKPFVRVMINDTELIQSMRNLVKALNQLQERNLS